MTPYRLNAVAPQPRKKRTDRRWLRALLWFKGTWKERMVRCAVCRKGVAKRKTVYDRGGEPGSAFIRSMLDEIVTFSCGHLVSDHKRVLEEE